MSEDKYRLCKLIAMVAAVLGIWVAVVGLLLQSRNGHYAQFGNYILDTRTGEYDIARRKQAVRPTSYPWSLKYSAIVIPV